MTQTFSLPNCKRLAELLGDKTPKTWFVWVERGQPYGDGYGNTAEYLTTELVVFVGGETGYLCQGARSSQGKDYKGDIKFDAVAVPEYGSDNYVHYPVSCPAFTIADLDAEVWQAIGEKLGWNGEAGLTNAYSWKGRAQKCYKVWLTGGYPEADKYLAEILK